MTGGLLARPRARGRYIAVQYLTAILQCNMLPMPREQVDRGQKRPGSSRALLDLHHGRSHDAAIAPETVEGVDRDADQRVRTEDRCRQDVAAARLRDDV